MNTPIRLWCLTALLLTGMLHTQAQTEEENTRYSISPALTLSFSGVNTALLADARRKHHALYAGPKLSIAESYLPKEGPFGLIAGYRFFILPQTGTEARKLNSFVNVDFQYQLHKAYRTATGQSKRYNHLNELNVGYGLEWQISESIAISNTLAFGRYLEIFNNPRTDSRTTFQGYNRMVRLQLLYTFRK